MDRVWDRGCSLSTASVCSPRGGGAVGDVVGVLKIRRPLDEEIQSARAGFRGAFVLMAATSLGLMGLCGLLMVTAKHRSRTRVQL